MSKLLLVTILLVSSPAFADQNLAIQRRICLNHLDHAKTNATPVYEPDFAQQCSAVDARIEANAPADMNTQRNADLEALRKLTPTR